MEYFTLGTGLFYFPVLGTQDQSSHHSSWTGKCPSPLPQESCLRCWRPTGREQTWREGLHKDLVCAARGIWANGNHQGHACLEIGWLFKAIINPSNFSLCTPPHTHTSPEHSLSLQTERA